MRNKLPTRDVVLIGAGHTNMHVARMFRMAPIHGVRLTIVSSFSRATYSGMLPGTLAGLYTAEDMEIDLWRLAAPSGIRVIIDEATSVDADKRRIHFASRPPIRFDIASIGIGSVPMGCGDWVSEAAFLPVKPMATFRDRLEARLADLATQSDFTRPIRAVVVGGGAAGTEISFCLHAFLTERGLPAEITLVDGATDILRGYEAKTQRKVCSQFEKRGIRLELGKRVTGVADDAVELNGQCHLDADIVLWATAASAPPLLENVNLPKADDGFLAVRSTLQTTGDRAVFVVGDSATLVNSPVRKAGVYAVRQGPVLWQNIRRMLKDQPLLAYQPQKDFLSLLADGTGRAFVDFQGMAGYGRWAWKLKDYIDRKFMRMYQSYEPMAMPTQHSAGPELPEMRCRGCGGKAGAGVLTAALEQLAKDSPSPESHSALSGPEDAAMLKPDVTQADLVSVDFFQAFMDDPWLVGRVAALNSLSDIWAMGARPFGAMAMVQVEEGSPRQQTELLYQVLSGAVHEFSKSEVELLGGHTTEASELTVGFTILGSLDGGKPLKKKGLKPGHLLILTKPLGTGVLLAGIPQALTRGEWVDSMLASMLKSNQLAASLARQHGCVALTDVTGFGLAGHLLEMLDASQATAALSLSKIPLLPGFVELAEAGVESTLAPANRELAARMTWNSDELATAPQATALCDPQTSGGLLIAVDGDNAKAILGSLSEADMQGQVIGSVVNADNSGSPLRIEK